MKKLENYHIFENFCFQDYLLIVFRECKIVPSHTPVKQVKLGNFSLEIIKLKGNLVTSACSEKPIV